MNTIFITVAETAVLRNILRTDFWEVLRSSGMRIVLVTSPELEDVVRPFADTQIIVETLPRPPVSGKEKLVAFIARNGFPSGTHAIMQHRTKEAGESRVPIWIKTVLAYGMALAPFLRRILRIVELRISPTKSVTKLFDVYAPSFVFSTVLVDTAIDVPLMREAVRRDISTGGMVRGWDNLTTYGLLRVLPDTFFAQNVFLAEKAVTLHGMPKDRVTIVGTPFLDAYCQESIRVNRETYCSQMNIDPSARIVLYGAIGDYLFPREGELANVFESLISSGELPSDTTVIFRAHPAFSSPLERMQGLVYVKPDRNATYADNVLQHWDMTSANTAHLINSIYHADVVVTAGSTLMIEAALLGKPVISVAFDGETKESYWFSIARFHEHAVHIVDLLKTGGVRVSRSPQELAKNIRTYLEEPMLDTDGRTRLVTRFAGPHLGEAGAYAGKFLLTLVSQARSEVVS